MDITELTWSTKPKTVHTSNLGDWKVIRMTHAEEENLIDSVILSASHHCADRETNSMMDFHYLDAYAWMTIILSCTDIPFSEEQIANKIDTYHALEETGILKEIIDADKYFFSNLHKHIMKYAERFIKERLEIYNSLRGIMIDLFEELIPSALEAFSNRIEGMVSNGEFGDIQELTEKLQNVLEDVMAEDNKGHLN